MTTGEGMTAAEIHEIVERMQGIVAILQSASTEDRRKVYEAAQLSITYDHDRKRAKLHGVPYVSEGGLELPTPSRHPATSSGNQHP